MNEFDELTTLRNLARVVRLWLLEKDGISQSDVRDALDAVRKAQREAKKRPN